MAQPSKAADGATQGDDGDKARVHRSPLYPFIDLQKAVERARQLYDGVKKNPARVPTAVGFWKYGPKSSGGLQTIAALKQFGLITDQGVGESRRVTLTDLGLRLALGTEGAPRQEALQRSALTPTIHAELWGKWNHELPDDSAIRDYLIFDKKFNPSGADDLVREYRDTLAFAGLLDSGNESLPDGDKTGEEVPPMDTPTVTPVVRAATGKTPIAPVGEHERLRFSLSGGRTVRLIFAGPEPTQAEIDDLMDYLKISRRTFPAAPPEGKDEYPDE